MAGDYCFKMMCLVQMQTASGKPKAVLLLH